MTLLVNAVHFVKESRPLIVQTHLANDFLCVVPVLCLCHELNLSTSSPLISTTHPAASNTGMTISLTVALALPLPPAGLTRSSTRRNGLRPVLSTPVGVSRDIPAYAASMTVPIQSCASGTLAGSTRTCITLKRRWLPLLSRVCRSRRVLSPTCTDAKRARRMLRAEHESNLLGAFISLARLINRAQSPV